MGRQNAVIDEYVDARSWRQRGQPLEHGEGFEAQMGRPVAPWRLEHHEHRTVGPQREAVLRDGRAQQVATELLEPVPVLARHRDPRVQVAAVAPRLQRPRRLRPRRVGIPAEALDTCAGPRSERQPPLDRSTRESGQRPRLGRERIGGVGIGGQASAAGIATTNRAMSASAARAAQPKKSCPGSAKTSSSAVS
jgi:hypothetical protein